MTRLVTPVGLLETLEQHGSDARLCQIRFQGRPQLRDLGKLAGDETESCLLSLVVPEQAGLYDSRHDRHGMPVRLAWADFVPGCCLRAGLVLRPRLPPFVRALQRIARAASSGDDGKAPSSCHGPAESC